MIEISHTIAEFLMSLLAALLWVGLWGLAIAGLAALTAYIGFRGISWRWKQRKR